MKIVLAGGGSGGHVYPLIAVAEELRLVQQEKNILDLEIYYMAHTKYDEKALFDNQIVFMQVPAGKLRRYFSLENIVDIIKTFFAIFVALFKLFKIYPDVVFSKGGYPSVPVVIAAKILHIPVVLHESDTRPGLANKIGARFADRIAVAFPEAAQYFKKEKTALIGHLVRKDLQKPVEEGAHEYLKLSPAMPTIFILGGSQGAVLINEAVMNTLPELVKKYQIIHQTGTKNFEDVESNVKIILENSKDRDNYRPYAFLNPLAMRMCAGAADVVISRSGASSISEIAWWQVPAILIPITSSNGDHQRQNAFSYASTGAARVIEEKNLTPQVLLQEIENIVTNTDLQDKMKQAAKFSQYPNSARDIANELIQIGFKHEE